MPWRYCSLELNHRYGCLYLCLNKNVDSDWLILTDYLIDFMVSVDYWLTDHPELRWTTQPSITGGPLDDPRFCFIRSTVIMQSNIKKHDIAYGTTKTEVKIYKKLYSRKTPHISPSRASYGVSFVRIWMKIDRIITALHCMLNHFEKTCKGVCISCHRAISQNHHLPDSKNFEILRSAYMK